METKKVKIAIPKGYRADWVNNVLTLVEDKPIITYKFRILRNGILLNVTFDTEEQAKLACNDGDEVVKTQLPTSTKSSLFSKLSDISLPKLSFDFSWILIIIGVLAIGFGLYKFILLDNESASTLGLIKIGAVTTVGIIMLLSGWKSRD